MATGTHAHHNCVNSTELNTTTEPNAPMRLPAGSHGPSQLAASHAHSFLLGTTRQQLAPQATRQRSTSCRRCKSSFKIHDYYNDTHRQAVKLTKTTHSRQTVSHALLAAHAMQIPSANKAHAHPPSRIDGHSTPTKPKPPLPSLRRREWAPPRRSTPRGHARHCLPLRQHVACMCWRASQRRPPPPAANATAGVQAARPRLHDTS